MTELIARVQAADFAALDFMRAHMRSGVLDAVMPYITHLGSAGMIWIILAIALLALKSRRRDGIAVSLALIFSFVICNLLLKNIVARTRPFNINPVPELLINPPGDYSFPSGHTASSFAAAAALMLRGRRKIGTAALLTAGLIAFSRLYLYVHFPSDVICGAVIGIAAAFAAFYTERAIYGRFGKGT